MTIPLRQRTTLQQAIEARQRLSRPQHDRASRAGDRLFVAIIMALLFAAYSIVTRTDEAVADIENHQRTAQR